MIRTMYGVILAACDNGKKDRRSIWRELVTGFEYADTSSGPEVRFVTGRARADDPLGRMHRRVFQVTIHPLNPTSFCPRNQLTQ